MTAGSEMKALPKEISYATHRDKEETAQMGSEENVVWRVMLMRLLELGSGLMSGLVSIMFVRAKTKL